MSRSSLSIQGTGYVPGIARGCLQRGLPTQTDRIALLAQADIAALKQHPAGLIIANGAPFSHTLISLLGQGIPTVVVAADDLNALVDGTPVQIDGRSGVVTTRIDTAQLPSLPRIPPVGQAVDSADSVQVELQASVRSVHAARRAVDMGAAAIGLVRTEFFEPDAGAPPDADFYARAFGALCKTAGPLPVTFRLLDIAADKMPEWLPTTPAMLGSLGLQGVRLYRRKNVRDVVRAQLRVIAQLAIRHRLRVLLPYLTRYEELKFWLDWVRGAFAEEASFEGIPLESIPIGAMIETPAAALDIAQWLDVADFVALGCNDLMQCLFAADRDQSELRGYLDPYAPVLYRFFRDLAERAHPHLGAIQLCGVLPQLNGVLPLLLGLGYRNFSVDAGQIPWLAETVARCNVEKAQALAQTVCRETESAQVMALLDLPKASDCPFAGLD